MTKIQIFTVLFFIFIGFSLSSQNIAGKVIRNDNEKSIPFASVAIEGTTIGMVTDFEGVFMLNIPEEYINGKLVVSCVGFKEKEIDIIDIYGNNNLFIKLEPVNVQIDEVVVEQKSLYPYTILKKSVDFIKDNYIDKPYNYEFYYLNKDIRRDEKLLKREAIVLMSDSRGYFKTSIYKTFKDINYRFLQSRRNFDVRYINEGNTNVDNLLEFDIARHSNNILNKNRLYDFEVVIKDEILYKEDSVWVLSYSCNKPSFLLSGDFNVNFYSGEIFVKKDDYAILYNKTTVKCSAQSKFARNLYVKPERNKLKNAFYNYEVTYKKENEKYILDKINYKINYNYKNKEESQIVSTESSFNVIKVITLKPHILDSRVYYEDLDFDKSFWAEFKH
ncbi:MAG: carboxypeptidase-like regulatory domain-containing protein [Bacteroidales bacterium]|nr:carboxypeptidase-like regulatory domain-containing protein [Bacteroidales bacterium]